MRSKRQPVAAGGNGFALDQAVFRASGEPNVCHRLRPLCSITVPSQSAQKRALSRWATDVSRGWGPFRGRGGHSKARPNVRARRWRRLITAMNLCPCVVRCVGRLLLMGDERCRRKPLASCSLGPEPSHSTSRRRRLWPCLVDARARSSPRRSRRRRRCRRGKRLHPSASAAVLVRLLARLLVRE
jgi:hypothetical protein